MSAKNGSIQPLNICYSETYPVRYCNRKNRKDFVIFIAMKGTKPLWENYTVEPLIKEVLHPDMMMIIINMHLFIFGQSSLFWPKNFTF